ncbi:hypothetical protein, partial [Salmonella sp. SAL4449]|uniref:hypothetical protein n=1 Tax=Salmonella sp. SAL4449 TaxID=3159904 RepID=UPI0039786617
IIREHKTGVGGVTWAFVVYRVGEKGAVIGKPLLREVDINFPGGNPFASDDPTSAGLLPPGDLSDPAQARAAGIDVLTYNPQK